MKTFQSTQNDDVKKVYSQFCPYFAKFYIPKLSQWIVKTNEEGKKRETTNNVLERFNGTLKQIIFHSRTNLSVVTVANEFSNLFARLEM